MTDKPTDTDTLCTGVRQLHTIMQANDVPYGMVWVGNPSAPSAVAVVASRPDIIKKLEAILAADVEALHRKRQVEDG